MGRPAPCDCDPDDTVLDAYCASDGVFVGEVRRLHDHDMLAVIDVVEGFRGSAAGERVEVFVNSECPAALDKGETWLVYAAGCVKGRSRAIDLDDPELDDLRAIADDDCP